MKPEQAAALIAKIDVIMNDLKQVRQSLEVEIATGRGGSDNDRSGSMPPVTGTEDLKREYHRLREQFAKEGRRAVEAFVGPKSATYLDKFITVNELPVPRKRAKGETLDALLNYLARSVLVRGS